AWLALGSVARREITLASDQDNALAYADNEYPGVDSYFERVAKDVNAGLSRAGFGADVSGVVARNALWRMPESGWGKTFRDCLAHPDLSHVVRAVVAFDFRHVAGGLDIAPPLVAALQEAPQHPHFLARLARTATDFRPALPHWFQTGSWERQELDLKKGAMVPIANLARFHALAKDISISSTLDRLVAAEGVKAVSQDIARSLQEAFAFVWQVRLDHHSQQIRAGVTPDNFIRPEQLPPLARTELREALRLIAKSQNQLNR